MGEVAPPGNTMVMKASVFFFLVLHIFCLSTLPRMSRQLYSASEQAFMAETKSESMFKEFGGL